MEDSSEAEEGMVDMRRKTSIEEEVAYETWPDRRRSGTAPSGFMRGRRRSMRSTAAVTR